MDFQLIAHRGASHDAPENTMVAIRLAWDQDADAVEIDCRVTADGYPIVFHDPTTLRMTAVEKHVSHSSLTELQELQVAAGHPRYALQRIPTLAEVIKAVPAGKRLFVEVKSSTEIVRSLCQTLQNSPGDAQLVVTSYDSGVLHAVGQQLPDLTRYLVARFVPLPEADGVVPTVDDLTHAAQRVAANGLNVSDHLCVDRDFCDVVKSSGLEVYVWTVDDPQRAHQLMRAGAAGVFTNRPGWLRDEITKLQANR